MSVTELPRPRNADPLHHVRMLIDGAWVEASRAAGAIRMANDSHYGLAAYVWSHDIGRALRAAHAIEAGWVQVNQGLGQGPGHSYGGYKESGIAASFPSKACWRATRRGRTSRST
jgi:acyl-CoA reductase-like NAD-dependent aldehyde dehydrogenase